MQVFKVGGAVRDEILGLQSNDHDYVVIGSTAEEMLSLGYTQVGKDFPVFLHPVTKDEYALARIERKTAPGYTGFSLYAESDVTLEQDLSRRDFTMNAIAMDEQGNIVDPFNGQFDLSIKTIRHVGSAFKEDPVRILRAARFASRFNFCIAPETMVFMQEMVERGDLDYLVPERVWQEVTKALMCDKPSIFFYTLHKCCALRKILPEIDALFGVPQPVLHHPEVDSGIHTMMVLDEAAKQGCSLEVRFACLMHDVGKGVTPAEVLPKHIGHEQAGAVMIPTICERMKVTSECRDLAIIVANEHTKVHQSKNLKPKTLVDLLYRIDYFRRPERLNGLLNVCMADAKGRLNHENDEYPEYEFMLNVASNAQVNTKGIASSCVDKSKIGDEIHIARIAAVKAYLK